MSKEWPALYVRCCVVLKSYSKKGPLPWGELLIFRGTKRRKKQYRYIIT